MNKAERDLRQLLGQVRAGALARRDFVQRLAALGLGAPLAGALLMHAGMANAQPPDPPYKPTRRGGGGTLKLLYWQGPTLLNPHFATSQKDQEGCRLFYEPLCVWHADGFLVPLLAAELPSRENGGVAADGLSVIWKLKRDVLWHDGQPFTADDVVFNFEYATQPDTAAVTSAAFIGMKLQKVDTHTVRVLFDKPTPFWSGTYATTMMVPRHLFAPFIGTKSRDAPNNLKPVGTGPYKFSDFKPGDLIRGTLNPTYHQPNRPFFDAVELKGGGDAVSAARAVIQTGEYDFAWNLQVEDELIKRLETGGKGRAVMQPGGSVEFIQLNFCDPWTEFKGERAHPDSRHPLFADPAVRQAMSLLLDRQGVQDFIYGRTARATANIVDEPPAFRSPNTKFEFNVEKANAVLEAAGWVRPKGAKDGTREKAGKKLKLVFQTSINAPRQKTQAILKQAAAKAGIEIEIKAVTGAVFFSSDVASPDTFSKFWADMQMYTNSQGQPDPERFMNQFSGLELASKANKWQRENLGRWRSAEYDRTYAAAKTELDPVKRAAMFIRCNDLVCNDRYTIPVVARLTVSGLAKSMVAATTAWSLNIDFIHDWYREAA